MIYEDVSGSVQSVRAGRASVPQGPHKKNIRRGRSANRALPQTSPGLLPFLAARGRRTAPADLPKPGPPCSSLKRVLSSFSISLRCSTRVSLWLGMAAGGRSRQAERGRKAASPAGRTHTDTHSPGQRAPGRQAAGRWGTPPASGPAYIFPSPGARGDGARAGRRKGAPRPPPNGGTRERFRPRSCRGRPREGEPGTCHSCPPGPSRSPARAPRRLPYSRAACSGARAAPGEGGGGRGRDSATARGPQLQAGRPLAQPLKAATNALRAPFPRPFSCFSEINFTGSARPRSEAGGAGTARARAMFPPRGCGRARPALRMEPEPPIEAQGARGGGALFCSRDSRRCLFRTMRANEHERLPGGELWLWKQKSARCEGR